VLAQVILLFRTSYHFYFDHFKGISRLTKIDRGL